MATSNRPTKSSSVKRISEGGVTVNVAETAKTAKTVTILFRSRSSQTFRLKSGREVTLAGNGVYLADAQGGALPPGGYGVTVVDADLWAKVKKEFGRAYKPWFDSGRIQESSSEDAGVTYAQDNAQDKTGDDPIVPNQTITTEAEV